MRALGLETSLVAVSHSCDFPGPVATLPRVTRTRVPKDASSRAIDAEVRECLAGGESLYELDVELLDRLRPDLIVTQALCEVCAVGPGELGRALPALGSAPKVLTLEPRTLEQVFGDIETVGQATGRARCAARLVADLRRRVEAVRTRRAGFGDRLRVAFLEWADPPMCGGHWNPELVELAGGHDGLGLPGEPSRTLGWDQVLEWRPEVMVLACCGFTAERAQVELALLRGRPGFNTLPCARSGRVHVVDGVGHFSRPGPSLVDSLEALEALLWPGATGRERPAGASSSGFG
ncbi:MAG: ABC transporter substrate-binding protein [Gemmatimonadales bacterium]|nr:ABC transporter substrate-binding protein [Gemmatimonadales bacterium]MDQ3427221.1 ABC transporter substrate-binding protein [Gemmatimonadota bacterium]